ncbi:iron-sulfur flavoprotein [Anaerovibrio sp. JC8]|uniref:flavodoxin family protein n=1 Tax=Anaerovibrio sp. JC8 TaxID=1240085 RepID=UPI000A0CA27F|nr:flavodoxin family protein [Anaerovibrio sp. JC8]ORT99909.1 iron-sulfur flavoprotein [Anaerovibrio sp. JC8]
MKIAIFNGSPRKVNTAAMVQAFSEGAKAAGHEVEEYHVGKMKIAGCLGCEYCHTKGEGTCVQKDDFEKLLPAYKEADMVVFASPIYYFTMTAQMQAAIQRVYCIGKPLKAKKAALLLSAASPGSHEGSITQFKAYMAYANIEVAGIITASGEENKSDAKMNEIKEFAKGL